MAEKSITTEPHPSQGEEIANSVSHAVGVIAALIAGPLLIMRTSEHGKPWGLSSAIVFVAAILVMYVASTLYHALLPSRAKRFFRTLEHCAIFLLIAGTHGGVLLGEKGSFAKHFLAKHTASFNHSTSTTFGYMSSS